MIWLIFGVLYCLMCYVISFAIVVFWHVVWPNNVHKNQPKSTCGLGPNTVCCSICDVKNSGINLDHTGDQKLFIICSMGVLPAWIIAMSIKHSVRFLTERYSPQKIAQHIRTNYLNLKEEDKRKKS